MSAPDRRAKLDRDHPQLSVRRQCAMLGLARSGVYRLPGPANDDDLTLLRRIDLRGRARMPFVQAALLRDVAPHSISIRATQAPADGAG